MLSKDQNGTYEFEIEINGNVPVFESSKVITFDDYVHTYRYDRQGIMSGYYSSMFNVGEKKYEINVVEVLQFDEVQGCSSVGSSKMAVSEQRSSYMSRTKILNFALKTEMQDEGKRLRRGCLRMKPVKVPGRCFRTPQRCDYQKFLGFI